MFQNVIEKVGMPKVLSTLALPITRIQQATVTMLAMLLSSDTRLHRFLQDKVSARHHISRSLGPVSLKFRSAFPQYTSYYIQS
jgi:hypothetical protein